MLSDGVVLIFVDIAAIKQIEALQLYMEQKEMLRKRTYAM